jgi:hypothetical protein
MNILRRRTHIINSMGGLAVFVLAVVSQALAQSGTLAEPLPTPSPNAALHYQRALLFLGAVDADGRNLLKEPVWEVLPELNEGLPQEAKRLLYRGRHAIRAASLGARLDHCDFGIDLREAGPNTMVPHAAPMLRLARLLTLRGALAESQGEWEEAAVVYFDGLRMGRHMTHQPTLIEAMAGIEMLENNYFALAKWAARSPSRSLAARAFGLLETLADDMIDPARTLSFEAGIMSAQFKQLRRAYPDGPWAEMILDAYELEMPADAKRKAIQARAIAECTKRGVPKEAFDDVTSFNNYLDRFEALSARCAEACAACMTLPPTARVERGQRIYEKYEKLLAVLGDDQSLIDPAQIGAMFATHEAELVLARTALAVAASKSEKGFPEKLEAVAARFGGKVPASPYDGSPLAYEVFDDGQAFSLVVHEVRVAGITLPQIDFDSTAPVSPAE